jgi:hypothetical protein
MNLFRLKRAISTNRKFNERALLPVFLVLGCFALSPTTRAVSPPPDGGYPGENTAEGTDALFSNTTGIGNTAVGFNALYSNTAGGVNTAVGDFALHDNIDGSNNTATGFTALNDNTSGIFNTADDSALHDNKTGNDNTASGAAALFHNTTGNENIALGVGAGSNLTTGDNNIEIGNQGVAAEANTIRIGTQGLQNATFIAGIIGVPPVAGPTVHISGTGRLGIGPPSSARFKDAIKPIDSASEAILALKPVTFRYKKELDPEGTPQFGLVAEDVEKVNPALVDRDAGGKPYTVRYEAVNAMLLNEFLKEHRKVERLKKNFESKIAEQQKQIEALTAGLQKVSAQVEMSRSAPQTVVDNH